MSSSGQYMPEDYEDTRVLCIAVDERPVELSMAVVLEAAFLNQHLFQSHF